MTVSGHFWGVVPCAQRSVGSLAVGIEQIVSMAYTHKRNTYYLGGSKRLNAAAKRYLCIACIAQRPLEALALNLLHDDRLLRNER